MVEHGIQLVDGVRAERIAHLGPVECDADGALRDMTVVGDVGEVLEPRNGAPQFRIEGHVVTLRPGPVTVRVSAG